MAIRVKYGPVRETLEAAYYAGLPEAKEFGLREKEFKAVERERRLNRILRERVQAFTEEETRAARSLRSRQQWFREQQVPAAREHEIRRMEIGAELAEKTDFRRADLGQEQAAYEATLKERGFKLQYTMKDHQRMKELNSAMQWVRDQHATGALNDMEAKQAMLDLHNAFNGIRKSQVPVKKQPTPEELWTQTTRTDPAFPGYVFGLDRSGAWRVLVDPTKGKEAGLDMKTYSSLWQQAWKTRAAITDPQTAKPVPFTSEDVAGDVAKMLESYQGLTGGAAPPPTGVPPPAAAGTVQQAAGEPVQVREQRFRLAIRNNFPAAPLEAQEQAVALAMQMSQRGVSPEDIEKELMRSLTLSTLTPQDLEFMRRNVDNPDPAKAAFARMTLARIGEIQ